MENKLNNIIFFEIENPNNANAVIIVLTAVTFPVPNLFITFVEHTLEIIVHPEITNVTYPASETESPNSVYIAGHAEPKKRIRYSKSYKIYIYNN